jgi:hypothetical protein
VNKAFVCADCVRIKWKQAGHRGTTLARPNVSDS